MKSMTPLPIIVLFICACSRQAATDFYGSPLPSFNILLMDSATVLNTRNIPSGSPVVIFFFNPNCPYCKWETQNVIANIDSVKNIRFYMLSSYPFQSIKKYYIDFRLNRYKNITVAQDPKVFFGKYYKASSVPYIAIYNSNKTLKKIIPGNISTTQIENIIAEKSISGKN